MLQARTTAISLVLTGVLSAAASAQIVPAQTFNVSAPGVVWSSAFCCDRTIGWEMIIGADTEVTALGVFDRGAPSPDPGLGASHDIAIWDLGQVMLAMTTVSGTGGTLIGDFRYESVTPFTLIGIDPTTMMPTNYKIAAFWPQAPATYDHFPDLEQSGITPIYHPNITFQSSEQLFGSTFGYPTIGSGNRFLAGTVNFLINDSGTSGPIGTSYCGPAIPNSSTSSGEITASGLASPGGLPLNLVASNLPFNQFGFFLTSMNQSFFNPPGSQGFICLGNPIGRFNGPGQIKNSGAGGTFDLDVDTNAMPLSPPVPVMSGQTWNFQAWFRDNNPSLTSNFTDGLSILFM